MQSPLLNSPLLYARLRWLGIALFLLALPAFLGTLGAVATGKLTAGRLLLAFGACALSLASFGTASDTALALARDQKHPDLQAELDHEKAVRASHLRELQPSPKMALLFPVGAILAILVVTSRLAALGSLS